MAVKQAKISEKFMLLLFPLITLSLFVLAILIFHFLPLLFGE